MAISFVNAGAAASGSTSAAPAWPASPVLGNIAILTVANKYPANGPDTPAGFTLAGQFTGGAGASGVDSGNVYITVFYKVLDGTETGTVTVSVTSGNSMRARIFQYTNGTGAWSVAIAGGGDNSAGTSWSVTGDVDPGITTGDLVFTASAINGNTYTYSAQTLTVTGVTVGTMNERNDDGNATGDDIGLVVAGFAIDSGTSSAAPVFAMTASGTAGNEPAGATAMLRLREVSNTINGEASLTLDPFTVAATGQNETHGAASLTLDAFSVAAVGKNETHGAASLTLAAFTVAATGTVEEGEEEEEDESMRRERLVVGMLRPMIVEMVSKI